MIKFPSNFPLEAKSVVAVFEIAGNKSLAVMVVLMVIWLAARPQFCGRMVTPTVSVYRQTLRLSAPVVAL